MRYPLIFAALAAAVALAGGCSSSPSGLGVANVGSATPSGTSSPTDSTKDQALAYSQCMRAHGIADFPDPDGNGGLRLQARPGSDLDPRSSRFKAAEQACKSLQPTFSPEQQARARAGALRYSKCMRDHGIKDFPDPDAQGRIQVSAAPGSDMDPNNTLFKAADRACASQRGNAVGPGAGLQTGGQ